MRSTLTTPIRLWSHLLCTLRGKKSFEGGGRGSTKVGWEIYFSPHIVHAAAPWSSFPKPEDTACAHAQTYMVEVCFFGISSSLSANQARCSFVFSCTLFVLRVDRVAHKLVELDMCMPADYAAETPCGMSYRRRKAFPQFSYEFTHQTRNNVTAVTRTRIRVPYVCKRATHDDVNYNPNVCSR